MSLFMPAYASSFPTGKDAMTLGGARPSPGALPLSVSALRPYTQAPTTATLHGVNDVAPMLRLYVIAISNADHELIMRMMPLVPHFESTEFKWAVKIYHHAQLGEITHMGPTRHVKHEVVERKGSMKMFGLSLEVQPDHIANGNIEEIQAKLTQLRHAAAEHFVNLAVSAMLTCGHTVAQLEYSLAPHTTSRDHVKILQRYAHEFAIGQKEEYELSRLITYIKQAMARWGHVPRYCVTAPGTLEAILSRHEHLTYTAGTGQLDHETFGDKRTLCGVTFVQSYIAAMNPQKLLTTERAVQVGEYYVLRGIPDGIPAMSYRSEHATVRIRNHGSGSWETVSLLDAILHSYLFTAAGVMGINVDNVHNAGGALEPGWMKSTANAVRATYAHILMGGTNPRDARPLRLGDIAVSQCSIGDRAYCAATFMRACTTSGNPLYLGDTWTAICADGARDASNAALQRIFNLVADVGILANAATTLEVAFNALPLTRDVLTALWNAHVALPLAALIVRPSEMAVTSTAIFADDRIGDVKFSMPRLDPSYDARTRVHEDIMSLWAGAAVTDEAALSIHKDIIIRQVNGGTGSDFFELRHDAGAPVVDAAGVAAGAAADYHLQSPLRLAEMLEESTAASTASLMSVVFGVSTRDTAQLPREVVIDLADGGIGSKDGNKIGTYANLFQRIWGYRASTMPDLPHVPYRQTNIFVTANTICYAGAIRRPDATGAFTVESSGAGLWPLTDTTYFGTKVYA